MLAVVWKTALVTTFVAALLLAGASAAADTPAPRPDPLSQIRAEHVMISTGDYDGTAPDCNAHGVPDACDL